MDLSLAYDCLPQDILLANMIAWYLVNGFSKDIAIIMWIV